METTTVSKHEQKLRFSQSNCRSTTYVDLVGKITEIWRTPFANMLNGTGDFCNLIELNSVKSTDSVKFVEYCFSHPLFKIIIVLYKFNRICGICRILFLVIYIFKNTNYSSLQIRKILQYSIGKNSINYRNKTFILIMKFTLSLTYSHICGKLFIDFVQILEMHYG